VDSVAVCKTELTHHNIWECAGPMDDSTIEHLLGLSPGVRTEYLLHYLLSPSFLGYWAFLRPKHKGTEVADILLIWGDVCFLFEVKTRAKPGDASAKWIKAKLEDAACQLNRRAETLAGGEVSQIRNKWRGIVNWNDLKIRWYYGIIIIQHHSDPYDPRKIAPRAFEKSKIALQVFSLHDFSQLIRVINTPSDFVFFYEMRDRYARKHLVRVHDEYETVKTIISQWSELTKGKPATYTDDQAAKDQSFLLELLKVVLHAKNATEGAYQDYASGLLVDLAIALVARKADQNHTGKHIGSKKHDFFVDAIRAIVELTRKRRSLYGNRWLRQSYEGIRSGSLEYYSGYSPSRKTGYLLISTPGEPTLFTERILQLSNQELEKRSALQDYISLAATSTRITSTYLWLKSIAKGENPQDLGLSEILTPIINYVKRTDEV